MHWCFIKCFLWIHWDHQMDFLLCSVHVINNTNWFFNAKSSLCFWNKFYLVIMYHFHITEFNLLIFLKDFYICIHDGYWGVDSFLGGYVSFVLSSESVTLGSSNELGSVSLLLFYFLRVCRSGVVFLRYITIHQWDLLGLVFSI